MYVCMYVHTREMWHKVFRYVYIYIHIALSLYIRTMYTYVYTHESIYWLASNQRCALDLRLWAEASGELLGSGLLSPTTTCCVGSLWFLYRALHKEPTTVMAMVVTGTLSYQATK